MVCTVVCMGLSIISVASYIKRTFRRDRLKDGFYRFHLALREATQGTIAASPKAPTVGADLGKVDDIPSGLRLALAP